MRLTGHVEVDAQRDAGFDPQVGGHVGDALQFEDRVDDDRLDRGLQRGSDLVEGLRHAVEDDLLRREAGLFRLPELATGVHLDVDPGPAHAVEEPQVRAGLAGVEDARVGVPRAKGVAQRGDVAVDLGGAEEEERRGGVFGHLRHIDLVEVHVATLAGEHLTDRRCELREADFALGRADCHLMTLAFVGAGALRRKRRVRAIVERIDPFGRGRVDCVECTRRADFTTRSRCGHRSGVTTAGRGCEAGGMRRRPHGAALAAAGGLLRPCAHSASRAPREAASWISSA